MSISKQFHDYPWTVAFVCTFITAFTVGFLYSCFWEIIKLKVLYRLFPCLEAHPNLPNNVIDERTLTTEEREQAHRHTELANWLADSRTGQGTSQSLLEDIRARNARLDAISESPLRGIVIHRFPMEERILPREGDSASSEAQPSNSTMLARVTLFLPSRTPFTVCTWVMDFLRRFARGPWHPLRSSIVIQAFLFIDSYVLAEIGELVKKCCSVENGFTLQIASWAIFYHNINSIHLLILKEGDVPVNIEARWNKKRIGITMRGLYLNGAQIKATTKRSSATLRSSGPPLKGRGNLDELHFPTEGFKDVEDSFIHAAKVVEFDGMSLVVRSEASYVVPPKSFLTEILLDEIQKILKMTESVLEPIPDLKTKQQLLVEYWKGVLQMEMFECRNKVISSFENLPVSESFTSSGAHPMRFISICPSSRDREYWQRALHDLSEDHLSTGSSSVSSTVHNTVGCIKFLLGEFESALLDLDRALISTTEGLATTLLDRAMVKCALARYPEASQDIKKAAQINPNRNDIKRFQACLAELPSIDSSKSSTPILQPTQPVLDLLTGDRHPHTDSPRYHRKWPPIIKKVEEFELPLIPDWTEVRKLSKDLPELHLEPETSHNAALDVANVSPQSLLDYLNLYGLTGYDSLRIGEKLAEGGQAEIFEALGTHTLGTKTKLVLKVFKQAFPLQTWLQPDVLQLGGVYLDHPSPVLCTALGVKFLNDGRCAFVISRHWGDLRRLIHEQIVIPFEFSTSVKMMLQVAEGMRSLHIRNILHRDLKASNILVNGDNPAREGFRCMVADFECSLGVMGTGFWRAPEILNQLKHRTSEPKALAWSKAADVYSFGMVCYEISTGRIPFGDLRKSDYDVVLSGRRPQLPPFLGSKLRTLIERCWRADPEQRPSFSEICEVLADVLGNAAGPVEHFETHDWWEDLMS